MTKRRVRDIYPLTPMQRGMLVHALRTPGEPVYHQQYVLAITGVADESVLRQAIADLVDRHTVLRTGFVWDGVDTPLQIVYGDVTVPFEAEDARGVSDVAELAHRRLAQQRVERFDLRKPPLLRARAVRVADAEWRLITMTHHIVLDGWSTPTLHADLAELLSARVQGRAANLPPAPAFREFVTWSRDNDHDEAAAAHFKRLLGDVRHATPLGVGRFSAEPGPAGFVELVRPAGKMAVLARANGLLPSTIAHAAWGLLIARCAGTPEAVFGTTVSGRPAELAGTAERVGQFVNTLPVRVPADGALRLRPWLTGLQEQLLAGHDFERTPVPVVQRSSAVPTGEPLYETMLGFHNYSRVGPVVTTAGAVSVEVVEQLDETGLPLVMSVVLLPGDEIWVRLEHDRHRVDRPVAEWLTERYVTLMIDLAAADDDTTLDDIPLLGRNTISRARPRSASRPFAELLPGTGLVRAAAEQLQNAGVVAGQTVALAMPAGEELLSVAAAGLWLGAHLVQIPGDATAAELAERADDADMLVVPTGTVLAVPPPATVVEFDSFFSDAPLPPSVPGGRWRGASVETLAEAVDVLAALPLAGARVAVALGSDEPALLPLGLAALATGARLDFRDPVTPGSADADVVIGPAAAVTAMVRDAKPASAVVVGDFPPSVRDVAARVWHVRGVAATGGVYACAGVIPGARVIDRLGRPLPAEVAGELVITGIDGDMRTGARARVLADGTLEDQDNWVAHRIAEAVGEAVVEDGRAWVVPADGRAVDVPALVARLRKTVPSSLLPEDIRVLTAFPLTMAGHVDRAALIGPGPAVAHVAPQPLANRLAALSAQRRTEFLDRLRAAQRAAPPLRPGRVTGPVPRSVQQEFYDLTAETALRPWSGTTESTGELSYADYAAWQRDPRRTAEIDRQAAYWRTVLRGAPASGFPADRVPGHTPVRGTLSHTVETTGSAAQWLAAVALTLARCGRDDDVVLGFVTRPELPAELAGVRGPFSRMLPIRLATGADTGLGEVARRAASAVDAARRSADVPWPVLRSSLAEDVLVSVAVHEEPGSLAPHAAATVGIDIAPCPDGTTVTAVFDGTKITERTVADLVTRFALLLRIGLAEPDRPVSAADLVTNAERELLMRQADGGTTDDQPCTVNDLVAEQAKRTPDAVAVSAVDGELTYRQLVDKAAGLAAYLRAQGIGIEDRVAVCLPRTSDLVWVPLGVMMAGAAYVPVDPAYPEARIAFLCRDADVSAVVTATESAAKFPTGLPVITSDGTAGTGHSPDVHPDNAAYVIYTSGSTGEPKGVVVAHRSVVDFSRHIATAYSIGPDTRLLGFAALTFDVSVFDLWSALCSGATVVLAGDEERASVDRLRDFMVQRRVTAAELPPSLMPLLDPEKLPDLRLVSVGGEAPAGVLVDDWATEDREFWNGYGPAETTVAVTLMRCEPPSGGRIPPIGRPMPNHRAYVLDEQSRPVPVGVPGELCVAGEGLARGYLGRPGLTADKFVPDPFAVGQRLYRTGDLARWAPDGVLEFLGRVDRQVKIRGFRVELGEVEAVLAADERVRQVAVEVWEENGVKHLTAYVVPTGRAPLLADIRAIAATRLPDYMTPTRLAVLDALPRTPSGKVDRRVLPEPDAPGSTGAPDETWSPLERTIADAVVGPLLQLSELGREQDFFELGGTSLQAMQVTSRVRDRFAVEISLADFFGQPTVANMARLIEEEQRRAAKRASDVYAKESGPVMEPGIVLPLAYQQAALFQAEEEGGADRYYHAPLALRLRGALDLGALRQANALLLRRHPTMRVSMFRDGDALLQRVLSDCDVPIELSDVDGSTVADRLRTIATLISEESAKPFDLAEGPLIRVRVYRVDQDDHVIQWTVHHLVTDGWSVGLFMHEVGTAYHAFADGVEPELTPLGSDYAEFVRWHRDYTASQQYTKDMEWWGDRLRGVSGLTLPTLVERTGHEFRPGYLNLRIEPPLAVSVQELGKAAGTSQYMTVLAAYATVLAAHSGGDDIAVVTPLALRKRSEWERLIGWFVNRVVVRLDVGGSATFADLLRTTRQASTAAFARHAVPFEQMRAELDLPDSALAACFALQNVPMGGRSFRPADFDIDFVKDDTGLDFAPIGGVYAPLGLRYETAVTLRQREDGAVAGGWEYDATLFAEDTVRHWSAGLRAILAHAAAKPDIALRDLLRIAKEAGE